MIGWMHSLPMTLAFTKSDLIIYGIGAIIVVGSWIANQVKQNTERQQRERRMASRSSSKPTGSGSSLDDLAARRREELRRAAQQRRTGGVSGAARSATSGGGGEPANLTMAERIERARAQETYRQRAQTLRKQQQQAPPAPAAGGREVPVHEDPAQVLAERQRREAEEALRQQQVAAEHARREREAQAAMERRRREAASRQRQEQEQEARLRTVRRQAARRRARPQERSIVPEHEVETLHILDHVHEHDAQARRQAAGRQSTMRGAGMQGRQLGILLTNAQSFRQALILKEVLDKPLSMRDPDADRFFA